VVLDSLLLSVLGAFLAFSFAMAGVFAKDAPTIPAIAALNNFGIFFIILFTSILLSSDGFDDLHQIYAKFNDFQNFS
jgi:hypothetical protein